MVKFLKVVASGKVLAFHKYKGLQRLKMDRAPQVSQEFAHSCILCGQYVLILLSYKGIHADFYTDSQVSEAS